MLFTLAWIAERFDTSALLAGFAAGIMVSFLGEPRRVADQLIGLGEGFFVPLFFVVLGARIDLRALVHSRDDLVLFAALALGTTLVPLLVAAIVRLPVTSGLLAAAEMGVPSAVASLGLASERAAARSGGGDRGSRRAVARGGVGGCDAPGAEPRSHTRTGRRGVNTNAAPPLILASAISGASLAGGASGSTTAS